MKINALGLAIIPLALLVHNAVADNLLNDGGFESGVLPWSSTKSILTLDPAAAYTGQSGMKVDSAYAWCPYGALYTLDTSQLQNGTMYEFGARIRLANSADTSANHWFGLSKNGADPIWLDGEQSAYDGAAYPDEWTHLYGIYKANFAATDSLKLCISGGTNKPFYVDDAFVKPLTSMEVGYQPPATLDSANLVHADGNRLVVGSGNTPFVMKGINVYQYDPGYGNQHAMENFKYKNADAASYQEIRELGFNTVRLNLSYSLFEDDATPGVYKEEGWAVVDRHIQWAQQNGIRLILDMHVPPGGYQSFDYKGFGSRPDLQLRLENLWVAIAQRYQSETTVAAYDLINEPYVKNWFAYAQTVISKIRVVDSNHTILLEESFHPKDIGMYQLADDNILYDIHYYDPWDWAGSHTNNTPYTGTETSIRQSLRDLLPESFYDSSTDSFNVPINIGEYGVVFEKYELPGVNGEQWLRDVNAAFEHFGFSRQLFHYNETNFGIYRSWNSYPNGHLATTEPLKAALPDINGTVTPPPPVSLPTITTTSLSEGQIGQSYSAQLSVSEGTAPYSWSLATGSLPNGLSMDSNGAISGTPTTAGTFDFTLMVSDSAGASDTQPISMTVAAAPVLTGDADMALTRFRATKTTVNKGSAAEFNFVLLNNGNDVARNARFVLPMPPDTTWVSGAAECTPSATEVVCSFGDLSKGTSRNRYIYLRPAVAASLTLTGQALSDTGDSNPANNSVSINLTVQ